MALVASTRTLKSGSHTVISANHYTCLTALTGQLKCNQNLFSVPALLNLADQWWESRTVCNIEGSRDESYSEPWRASHDADYSAEVHAVQQAMQPTRVEFLKVLAELLGTQSRVVDGEDLQGHEGSHKCPLKCIQRVYAALSVFKVSREHRSRMWPLNEEPVVL